MIAVRLFALVALSLAVACSSVSPDPVGQDGDPPASGGPDAAPPDFTSCQGVGNELVYLVDSDYRLLSFDPREIGGSPFTVIGQLNCPAGPAWPEFDTAAATPFSMSVDRSGTAWVLYSSGEIFKVSTTNATCAASSFQKGQKGFELFGMGFVSDAAGSDAETLFVAGGDASQFASTQLGSIDTTNLLVNQLGSISTGETSPEMTGTGEGELYGYFPGFFSNFIARLDKNSGSIVDQWDLDPLSGSVSAWAFAHWGGKFYMFVTTEGLTSKSEVRIFDPASNSESVAVANSPYRIVGAGVSTCAPIVVE